MNERAVSLAIVKSIQHISEAMQVETIVESIEEKGLLTALQEMGVNFG
jgi:EAL domain-containing protein (putative c-di-GMP-specific phosphodiesterase class I)